MADTYTKSTSSANLSFYTIVINNVPLKAVHGYTHSLGYEIVVECGVSIVAKYNGQLPLQAVHCYIHSVRYDLVVGC